MVNNIFSADSQELLKKNGPRAMRDFGKLFSSLGKPNLPKTPVGGASPRTAEYLRVKDEIAKDLFATKGIEVYN